MNKFTLFILFSFSQTLLIAQTMVLDSIINLSTYAQECSGMIFCNQKLIACNDSGGENCLFEIDTATGQVTKKIYIENASNADWEALAQDSLHIYIGDIGNNLGNRTNLCIYKINKNAYFNTTNDTISAEKIFYSYADQNAFIASNQNTPYDAEALVCINDSLYIFTKDWVNQHTSIYAMPTLAGTYSLEKRTQYDVQALVTDAAYDAELNHIYLTAYTKLAVPYILYLKPDMPNLFFEGIYWRKQALVKGSFQIESICKANQNRYYVGAEKFFTAASLLSSFYDSTLLIS